MAGLVTYGSSDEEDTKSTIKRSARAIESDPLALPRNGTSAPSAESLSSQPAGAPGLNGLPASLEKEGPVLGPSREPLDPSYDINALEAEFSSGLQSPYSANRSLIRSLTLPSVPSYTIPPSPPGSPLASTNNKFTQFMALKKRGVHFNEKLTNSSAMKNPGLFEKLMDFAGVGEQQQYATTLGKDFWDPDTVPKWAWQEELGKSQQEILKQREEEKSKGARERIDFVPAGETSKGDVTGAGAAKRSAPTSAAERVMSGMEGGTATLARAQGQKRKSRFGPGNG